MTEESLKVEIAEARKEFLTLNPHFRIEQMKGRNRLRRTRFVSKWVQGVARKEAEDLHDSISLGYRAGYGIIFPMEFVAILAKRLGLPIELLSNGEHN